MFVAERNNCTQIFGSGRSTLSDIRWQDSQGARNHTEIWHRKRWNCAHGCAESQTGMIFICLILNCTVATTSGKIPIVTIVIIIRAGNDYNYLMVNNVVLG